MEQDVLCFFDRRPEVYIVVTFRLGYCVESPRIDAAVEPYPGHWTHYVLIAGTGEVDIGYLFGGVFFLPIFRRCI